MRNCTVPDTDHVSRYCKPTSCTEQHRPTGAAFQCRVTEKSLSVNWLEFLKLRSREEEITKIRRLLESKLKIGTFGRIAILNVGDTRRHVLNNTPDRRVLTILHEPEETDPSHSGIYGLEEEGFLIGELIAEKIEEIYPVRER